MVRSFLYTVLLLVIPACFYGQLSKQFLLTPITEDNGLSDNHVNCVLKDKDGFIWAGTEDGLNVLDGSKLTIFKHQPADSTSLSGNNISALKEDGWGNIWIGTNNGVSCYQKKQHHFISYFFNETSYGGAINMVTGLIINNSHIWVATDGGLFHLDANTGKHRIVLAGNDKPIDKRKYCNKINKMTLDLAGTIWLCTWDGLWSYKPAKNFFKQEISAVNDPGYDPLCMSLADAGNEIWIGTWGKGLKRFNKQDATVTTYLQKESNISSITSIPLANRNQLLWLSGVSRTFNPVNKSFVPFPDPVSGVTFNIKNVYVSDDKMIWLCTDNGLYMYNPQRQSFKNFVFKNDITSQGLVFNNIDNQVLMAAADENILKQYDSNFNASRNYYDLVFRNYQQGKEIAALSILVENKQSWWLATSGGVVHINPENNSNQWFVHNQQDSTSLPKNFITKIFIDSKSTCWIFPWRAGIWQMDKTTGKCKNVMEDISSKEFDKNKLVIADAVEDDAGNIWLADLDDGILLYNRQNNHFSKPFVNEIGPGPRTFRLYKQHGFLYSVANDVFIKWKDARHCTAIPFPVEMQKYIYDFAPDNQAGWWFATKNGLVYYNEKLQTFKRFTTADGLYRNDLPATMFCKADGEMIIGANNFISSFFPEKILGSSSEVPPLVITGFAVNGKKVAPAIQKQIDLTHVDNNITISWALPDYTNPFRNQYYYKLQGIDSIWRYVGNSGELQYANLSPGNYIVALKAETANGIAVQKNGLIHFVIHPPFWKTAWFIAICILLLCGLAYFLVSKRIKTIKNKAAIQQQLSELEMKALRAQMDPHFIFNSLNSIQECIVMNNTAGAYEYLSKFSKLVRRILENSGKLFVQLKEETELLQWYVQLEQLRFKEPVNFSLKTDEQIDTDNVMIPAMILQPYVENALWHGLSAKEGEKRLLVSFVQVEEFIKCTIEDNGLGRRSGVKKTAVNNHKKSMGIAITKERLELFNQQAKVETHDLFDENLNPAGTKVIIYLPVQ